MLKHNTWIKNRGGGSSSGGYICIAVIKKKEEFFTHKGIIGYVRLSSDKREPLMVRKRRFYGSSAVGRSGRGV